MAQRCHALCVANWQLAPCRLGDLREFGLAENVSGGFGTRRVCLTDDSPFIDTASFPPRLRQTHTNDPTCVLSPFCSRWLCCYSHTVLRDTLLNGDRKHRVQEFAADEAARFTLRYFRTGTAPIAIIDTPTGIL
ncbi:hypothetical protein VTJ04DRAFT_633 [Mycothermus thermophilus]|uniref:uncharacterized protein n=1 Tax=Humicola insolens TaxID=85995 RepID=UPI0037428F74